MNWTVALAWIDAISWRRGDLLGIWRARRGPGPWSIYVCHSDGGMLEFWATPDGKLFGKVHASLAPNPPTDH